jgi:GNAT superfamily N-acetyltransferase
MPQFQIETYHHNHLEGITALYNTETAFEPHIAPFTPDRFIQLVEQKSYFDPQGLLVALAAGRVVGWVHACVAAGSERGHDPAKKVPRIRMLIFPRDRLKVGNALVAEATAWLKQTGQTSIEALHARTGYPFYRGLWAGGEPMGPSSLPHMHVALETNGYKNTQESIFMVAEMPVPPPVPPATIPLELVTAAAEMHHEPMRESWIGFAPMRTRALHNGEEVGNIGWVIQPYLDRLGAACMNIWGLGVKEPHRRQGIAVTLVAQAMHLSHAQGARFASVGTQLWNAPAHATYAKWGYRPYALVIGRALDLPEGKSS